MHSRHGSRPDGFRCIAPPRASIPESADSLAHPSQRHKRKINRGRMEEDKGQKTEDKGWWLLNAKRLPAQSFVFCLLSFVLQ